uniref:Prolactin receptor n=1 Tax=Sparus aurata TaxID=8175 RepID=A0A671W0B7_SPAAU
MKKVLEVILLLLLLVVTHAKGTRYSPPGKPALTRCRSPEKETFTCWWEPGSDGGLPTTYALYYRKESSDTVFECPDYRTAGENSCFFNKNDTSIWVNYNITVVATNALGRTFSDPVDIDVVYIVKPNPPEQVAVTVMEDKGWPFIRVSWEPPHKADTRSGWITLIYEIRVKLEEENDWEMHLAGQQKMFNIFSLRSGGKYLVQVRCKPDHGYWSEWSPSSYVKVPDYFHREKSVWILITVFCAFIFLILTWLLHMNSRSLKHFLLPPVPGPKIKGFDKQLLKNGKSEEVFSALVATDFPPKSSNYEDLLVEYLEVYIPEEQELMLEKSMDLDVGCLKCEGSASDSDSGRGSCDSHTLLMHKCDGVKEEEERQAKEAHGPGYWECGLSNKQPHLLHPQAQAQRQLQARSDDNISSIGRKQTPAGLHSPARRSTEYVEVERVNEEDMVLLQPVSGRCGDVEGYPEMPYGEDYSKVKGVDMDNMLLLQREVREETENCDTSSTVTTTQKPAACIHSAMPVEGEMVLGVNGYVDTATVCTPPTY